MYAEKQYFRAVAGGIVICHLLAGGQFWLKKLSLDTRYLWENQFYIILGVSLLLSLGLFSIREKKIAASIVLGGRILTFLIIGNGEWGYVGVEFTLLPLLLIEFSAYFRPVYSLLLTAGLLALTIINQHALETWDTSFSSALLREPYLLTVYVGIIAIFSHSVRVLVHTLDIRTEAADHLRQTVSQLMSANVGFQQYATTASEKSALLERQRISRDIHDTAVHLLVNIIMLAEAGVDLVPAENAKLANILQQIITQAKAASRDTRQALRELRAVEDPSLTGLRAIMQLVKVFQESTGVQVDVDFGNVPWELEDRIDRVLYRMIQEGLSNAFRHGKATKIYIRLWIFQSELIVRIHDNGQGVSEIKKGIGLHGMEERIQELHGRLQAKNAPGGGFEVVAWIPLPQKA